MSVLFRNLIRNPLVEFKVNLIVFAQTRRLSFINKVSPSVCLCEEIHKTMETLNFDKTHSVFSFKSREDNERRQGSEMTIRKKLI